MRTLKWILSSLKCTNWALADAASDMCIAKLHLWCEKDRMAILKSQNLLELLASER
jgi:hypothetical protein